MKPCAHSHIVIQCIRVNVCRCNSNKNLKTLLRKEISCEENNGGQRGKGDLENNDWVEDGRELGAWYVVAIRTITTTTTTRWWWWRRRRRRLRRRRRQHASSANCTCQRDIRPHHPYLATIPGSGVRDGKRLIVIVKRAARIPVVSYFLSSWSHSRLMWPVLPQM